jgi:hypothetical protein
MYFCEINLSLWCVIFEALTAVVLKISVYWDITPCNLLEVNRRFGGIFRVHIAPNRRLKPLDYKRLYLYASRQNSSLSLLLLSFALS